MRVTSGRLTLWGIEVFLAVAEDGSVSAAARRLGASASAVSQQLTNLEEALGTKLLDRSSRPAQLTSSGRILRRRAQRIVNEALRAKAELAAQDLSQLTDLRLGMIEDFDADVTPRLLSDMAGELQNCRFLLETGASHRLLDLLEARALDMVVCAETDVPPPAWTEVHPLMDEPFVAAVPRGAVPPGAMPEAPGQDMDSREGSGPETARAILAKLPLIQYTERHFMGRLIAGHLARERLEVPHRFSLDSYHAILAMVAAGTGWTILTPLGYLRAQRFRDEVDLIPLPMAPLSRRISLTARAEALQDMPAEFAARLRPLLAELIVAPVTTRLPWLAEDLRVL